MIRPPPRSTLFPYTPLSRSDTQEEPPVLIEDGDKIDWPVLGNELRLEGLLYRLNLDLVQSARSIEDESIGRFFLHQDRKSTRLNSSHSQISYAVFCLKKKNK